jgi:ATP-dependent DNA helicase RecG
MELLVGSRNGRERAECLERLARGEIELAIGTHALVEPDVAFKNLGMVVVDEQHKFGVLQRHTLRQKGRHPDVLVMTATPIPRTLSLTVFGDLDCSVLDEMPPNRRPVKTFWAPPEKRDGAYDFICERLAAGEQAFIVYPLVEESDRLDLQAAVQAAADLQAGPLRDYRVGLLHGRMSATEKNRAMDDFRQGRTHVLVSTIVIEVGIDVPNASVMIVEHAERFGLAQLHQLRGRIGRGGHTKQAWFVLFGEAKTEDARARLRILVSTTDGFRIAEEDLRLRGPGEFFGTRQHGLPALGIGDIIRDFNVLRAARHDAFRLVADDPDLARLPVLRQKVMEKFCDRLELIHVG